MAVTAVAVARRIGQRIQVDLPHAAETAQVTIEADTYRITVEDGIIVTAAPQGQP